MAKTQHVVELPAQAPRRLRDGKPVLQVELPREVTDPEKFEDVDLIPAGDREIVPTGLAPLSDVLTTGLIGTFAAVAMRRHRRKSDRARQDRSDMDAYVRSVGSQSDPAGQIARAKDLLDEGAISKTEFDQIKQKALA
jgi:hypothetical protein